MHTETEKTEHIEAEKLSIGNLSRDQEDVVSFDPAETKRILRKVDWHVIPLLTILYIFSFLDRSNIGNAKIVGMMEDLNLTGAQYNACLTVFFATYIAFEIPSNMVLKVTRPSWWIAFLVIGWGTVATLQGIVKDYHGLLTTRIFLGLMEAGFFPAASYLLTTWYCRFELQSRLSVFFSSASFASGFSGLLAFAISKMDGVAGMGGWRWIFILEGIATVVIGGVIALYLPDSIEEAKFLSEQEKKFLAYRLRHDGGGDGAEVGTKEPFEWRYFKAALGDWHIYVATIIYWGNSICLYGFNFTAPSIIHQLGYTAATAQLLTVPLYSVGVITTIGLSFWSDRAKVRWPFIVFPYCVSMLGFVGLLSIPHPKLPGLTYGLLFTIPGGGYPPLLTCLAWLGNNLAPSWKRSVGMALFISLGNVGGIIASNIFLAREQPHYWTGYGLCLAITVSAIVATFVLKTAFEVTNKRREAMSDATIDETYEAEELVKLGDRSPRYRYVL